MPTIEQQGGQENFSLTDLQVDFLRSNKLNVTQSGSDVIIDHGTTNQKPFKTGDQVLVDGDTDIMTQITNIARNIVPSS